MAVKKIAFDSLRDQRINALLKNGKTDLMRNRLDFPSPKVYQMHVFTADILKKPEYLSHAAQLKGDHSIVGLISDNNTTDKVLHEKTDYTFDYVHSPAHKRSKSYLITDLNEIVEQFRRKHPGQAYDIASVSVYGEGDAAFNLAQTAHVSRNIMPPAGRRIIYRHFAPHDPDIQTRDDNDFKNVFFSRVDPETGLYVLNGKNFLYQRKMSDDPQFVGDSADAIGENFTYPGVAPVDEENNDTAFKKIKKSPLRTFFRLVLKDEPRGAAAALQANELRDESDSES